MVDSTVPDWANSTPVASTPSWAARTPIQEGGQITEPDSGGIGGLLHRAGQVVQGAFQGADLAGFGGWADRTIDKLDGYAGTPWSTDKMTAQYPTKSSAEIKAMQEAAEQNEILNARHQAAMRVASNSQGFNPLAAVAGIAGSADPTWALGPEAVGLKVGGGLIAHAATSGLFHAAVGAADDAAYQGADIIDGLQKGFDVKRNLMNAAGAGVVGAAAPVVSKFVSDLFQARGVDTLPAEDPLGVTTPMTGQGLSPEETAQYHQVLQTGNEQDIRGFFNGRNTAPPSFADAHEWVQRRDAVNDGIAPSDYADDMFKPQPPEFDPEIHRQQVEDHVAQQTSDWKNAPDINVVHGPEDIQDPTLRSNAMAADPQGDALGFYDPESSQVHMYASRIPDADTANSVLYHESLGHYGLAEKFGDKLDNTLQTLLDRNVGQFSKDVDKWQAANPDEYGGDRLRAAEEVLAEQSQNGVIKPSIMDAVTANVRDFGRKMGLKLNYSDGEVKTILSMAHDSVVNGNGRDVASNGFRTPSQPFDFDNNNSGPAPQFMRKAQLEPKEVADEAFERLGQDYQPKYRSWDEATDMAKTSALDPSAVKDSRSVGNLDKKLFVYDNAASEANNTLLGLHQKAETEGLTSDDFQTLIKTANDFHYVLGRLDNDLGQVGRALNAAKQINFRRNNILALRAALEAEGSPLAPLADHDNGLMFLKQYSSLMNSGNANGAARLLKGVSKPNWEDYLTTLHQNMMLSAVSTHVKAPLDMMIGIGRELLDNAASLPLGAGREALRALGVDVKPGVHPTETAARLWGVLKAAFDAQTYRNTIKTFANGGQNPNGFGGKTNARIPGVSKVTDLISAQDAFFRAFATNMHLYGLSARKVLNEARTNGTKLSWDDVMTRTTNEAMSPSADVLKAAKDAADKTLLLNKNPLTEPLDRLKNTTQNSSAGRRAGAFVANFLTPFIRVETNSFMNRIIQRSPAAIFTPSLWKTLQAGGPEADIALMKVVLGTASIASYWMAAESGKTTGDGPDSPTKKAELEASGWRPNAVHENGQYNTGNKLAMSLNPFDVHNSTASIVAAAREAYKNGASKENVGTGIKLAVLSTMKQMADMSWISDIAPAVNALTAPNASMEQRATQFSQDEAGTMMPNLTSQAGKIADPNVRDTYQPGSIGQSVLNTIKSDIPIHGVRDSLPVRYDVYGNPKPTGTSLAGQHTWLPQNNYISGGNHINETTDPTEIELNRLANLTPAAIVTPTAKTIHIEGASLKLAPDQAEDYQKYTGQTIVQAVKDQMQSGDWQRLSDQDKINEVRSIQKQAKAEVKDALLEKEGWLKPDQLANLRKQLNGQ